MDDCIFCKIIKRELPTTVKSENESVIAFVTNKPAAKVHILIVPKKHISTFLDISENDKEILYEMKKMAEEVVEKENIKEAYKLIFNGGNYQSVKHLHWHLLGGEFDQKWTDKL